MTTLATAADLTTEITSLLYSRPDIVARIPSFIVLAEARLNTEIEHPSQVTRDATVSVTSGTKYASVPSACLELQNVQILTPAAFKGPLQQASYYEVEALREANPNGGRPVRFAVVGDRIELGPVPNQTTGIEITYRSALTTLANNDSATNWLLTLAPDAYLYTALIHSAPWLDEDARLQTWGALSTSAIQRVNASGERKKYPGPLTARVRSFG